MSGDGLELHTYFRSSAAWRVRIALALKGLEWRAVAHHLPRGEQRGADYLSANPQGLVPALRVDGELIAQSLAIIEYLEERWPRPALLPDDALARAHVRSMAQHVACDIHPLNNLRVLVYLRERLGHEETEVDAWYAHWIALGLGALERQVGAHTRGYCYGDRVTLADVCLYPQIWNARRFRCDLTPYPTLMGIAARLEALPAFDATRPESQPDAG